MSLKKYIDRFKRIDQLIRLKATGTPKELAEKLHISEALLYLTLSEMKELGAPICYDKSSKTIIIIMNLTSLKFYLRILKMNNYRKLIKVKKRL